MTGGYNRNITYYSIKEDGPLGYSDQEIKESHPEHARELIAFRNKWSNKGKWNQQEFDKELHEIFYPAMKKVGFIKRAQEYGLSLAQAEAIYKLI